MFGLLKGCGNLTKAQHSAWWSHVCGACVTLGKEYGQLTRFGTSFDASVLSLLIEAQSKAPLPTHPQVCAFRGFRTKDIVKHDTKAAQYASLVNMAIVGTKLRDKAKDGDSLVATTIPSAFVAVADSFSGRLQKHAHELEFSNGLDTILQLAESQNEIEHAAKSWHSQTNVNDLEVLSKERFLMLSKCTEESSAIAFAHTSALACAPENNEVLYEIGTLFGRIMYLLDSFEDYKWDTRAKRFNALHSAFPQLHDAPSQRAYAVKKLFDAAFLELKTHISNLSLLQKDSAGVVKALLVEQLHNRGRRIFAAVSPSTVFFPLNPSANNCSCNSQMNNPALSNTCHAQLGLTPILLTSSNNNDSPPRGPSPLPPTNSSNTQTGPSGVSDPPRSSSELRDTNSESSDTNPRETRKAKKQLKPHFHIKVKKPKVLQKDGKKDVDFSFESKRDAAKIGIVGAAYAVMFGNKTEVQSTTEGDETKKEQKDHSSRDGCGGSCCNSCGCHGGHVADAAEASSSCCDCSCCCCDCDCGCG